MKKTLRKLSLNKTTVSNLSKVKGGAPATKYCIDTDGWDCTSQNFGVCWTTPQFCGTTAQSACTACYSCIECPAPPETSVFIDCGCYDITIPVMR
jgi:hypothetical protein